MIRNVVLAVIVGLLICQCTATKKFDYQSAYKFRYIQNSAEGTNPEELVKLDPKWNNLYTYNSPGIKPTLYHKNIDIHNPDLNILPPETNFRTIQATVPNHEKRALKKELKSLIKNVRKSDIQKMDRSNGYRDTHPALKGFIFVLIGFGVILVSSLLSLSVLSPILLIVGFILVGYGLLKLLLNR